MDKLRAMQTFIRIVDDGSLTAAARTLGSSLPAVVRTLSALEDQLGARLLNRTTRRISLTDEGRAYLDSCRRILADVDDAEAALNARQTEPAGTLAITAPVLFGEMYVAPAVIRFVQRYPKVRCSVHLADHVVNLLEHGIDVGVRIGELADSTLVAHPVGVVRRVVVASPAYLAAHGEPDHPDALRDANCIRFMRAGATDWTFQENGRDFAVPVAGNLDFSQGGPAIEACAAGLGFGTFLSYQVAPYVAHGRLRIVLDRYERPARPVSIVYPHARLLPSRTRAFVAWMKDELARMLADPAAVYRMPKIAPP